MFKKASLRFLAGMLFGSTAGVFLGLGYNAVAAAKQRGVGEWEQMNHLLNHVIWGAFFGLFFGGVVALGRKPLATAFVVTLLGVFGMYLGTALFSPAPDAYLSRMGLGAGMMAGAALALEFFFGLSERGAPEA